ncbi:MBL fold metallo-hydrolase [Massilia violaceinigra]|uniref:MBL fold metallo-hydrolase n=1 Tax=Massilia violaceinigra TaxID=2045208 RepID=A0A2D2DMQ5_9BURK|nr:MBL fold metallo-hydrolase [Massilia violaceinigra]ATQ76231.1 MBL fold metallo-hydrolase [Massilia violaceinigra]
MAIELFNNGKHICLMFSDLVDEGEGASVQSNQFLIVQDGTGILLDPGGVLTYNELYMEMSKYFPPKQLLYVFASHADPDIIASLPRWLAGSDTKLLISSIWSRFVPHFCAQGKTEGRIIAIPDEGSLVPLGETEFQILPAHFLHAEGNFQFFDPVSRILFSGDMGASMLPEGLAMDPVQDFDKHLPYMRGFHSRYMVSNKVCRYWVEMVRKLDPEWMVPQHGAPFKGRAMIARFLDWIDTLPCGVDLMTQEMYQAPRSITVTL